MRGMGEQTKFSIVIATRNRGKYLQHCLKTCLNQNYENYEIIVSDNFSEDNTKEVVEGFKSDKIKYFKTCEALSMTANYNFALTKVTGDYIIYLGDDDGMLFHALRTLDHVIQKSHFKVISWELNIYNWPDFVIDQGKNMQKLYFQKNAKVLDNRLLIKAVLSFKKDYTVLPMLYMKSAIHKSVIQKIKKETGVMFDSQAPDVYAGFAIASFVKRHLLLGIPLTIQAAGGKSTGIGTIYKKDGHASKDYMRLNEQDNKKFRSKLFTQEVYEIVRGASTAVEDSFRAFQINAGLGNRFRINFFNMITYMCNEELSYLIYIKSIKDRKKEYENFKKGMLLQLKDHPLYLLWAKFLLFGRPYQSIQPIRKRGGGAKNKDYRVLYDYTVNNSYEVCVFTEKEMRYEKHMLEQGKVTKKNALRGYLFALKLLFKPVLPDKKGFKFLARVVDKIF